MENKTKKAPVKKTAAKKTTSNKKTVAKKTVPAKKATNTTAKVEVSKTKPAVKEVEIPKTEPKKKVDVKKIAEVKLDKVDKLSVSKTDVLKRKVVKAFNSAKKVITKDTIYLTIIALLFSYALYLGNQNVIPKLENGLEAAITLDGKKISVDEVYNEFKTRGSNNLDLVLNMIDTFIANKEIETTADIESYADVRIETVKADIEENGEVYEDVLKQANIKDDAELKEIFIAARKKEILLENKIKETITEEDITKYYETSVSAKVSAKHILIATTVTDEMTDEEKKEADAKDLAKANEVIKKLTDGTEFEKLVTEYSADTASVEKGGLYENFAKGDMVDEFWNASLELEDGEYTTTPVKTQFGYHIILKVSETAKPTIEEARESIIDSLYEAKQEEDSYLANKIWVELRKDYDLNIIDTDLKSVYNTYIEAINKKDETK